MSSSEDPSAAEPGEEALTDEDASLVAELTELENAWWRALRDRDWPAARAFMRDDFLITTAGWIDAPLGADAWLESLAGRYRLNHFEYDEIAVHRYADVAVVLSRSAQGGSIADSGELWARTFRYTDVWIRGDPGGWRIAIRHASIRPQPGRL